MASAINSAARSVVSATVSGSTVSLSSVGTGAGTDYAVSVAVADTQTAAYPTVFPSPSFAADVSNMTGGSAAVFSGSTGAISLAGTEAGPLTAQTVPGSAVLTVSGSYVQQQQTVCVTVPTGYENYTYQSCSAQNVNSTLSVTIHGFTAKVSYGSAYSAGSIAAALASSFNVSGSPVTAVSSGSMVTVTAVASGPGSDYPILVSAVGGYTISSSSATLTGVINPTSFYDAGTATATLTNSSVSPAVTYTATVNWGRGDTSATLAGKLSTAINNSAGSIVTATASGSSINLVSSATGLGANYPLSVSIADTQTAAYPTLFPRPSFSATVSSMSGGGAPDANYGFIYSYWVPTGGYAPNGNILAHVDSVMGDWLFTYDMVDRLTMAAAGSKAPTQYAGNYGCWTYDSYGNRTLEAFSSASCGGNPTPQALNTYNAANNRIVYSTASPATVPGANAFGYDASGNTLYDGNNEYWYDAEGQLCAVQSLRYTGGAVIQYVYDAEGARIAKGTLAQAPAAGATCAPPLGSGFTLTARYLVDLGGDQVTELNTQNGTASVPLGWAHSNLWAGGKLTATYDPKGIHFEITDPLGTKRVQANALGQVDEQCTSLPFGNDVGNPVAANCTAVANSLGTNDDATEHHFTGKERDTESGNDYFDARYYSSAMGRFMSPDWSTVPVPIPFADITNPQSLNLYAYVGNNPLTRFDSDGHVVVDKGITYVYYDVTGANANEAIANANTHFDGQFSGMTTPTFQVNFKPSMSVTDSGENTKVTLTAPSDDKVTTTLSQTIQLPSWKSSDPAEQATFDKSTAQLKGHEETHAADNRAVAETLDKSIPGTSASATSKNPQNAVNAASTKLNTKVGDKVNAAVADSTQRAKVLDDKTAHGTKP